MTPIRSSKLSPSVESLRSFRPRPTETSSGSATSHSIVNAIWSSASSTCSSTSAPSPHVTTSLRGNCPGWLASDGPEGEDQFFRLLHERFEDIPALLFGGREHGSDDHEVIGAVLGTESTGDFLP